MLRNTMFTPRPLFPLALALLWLFAPRAAMAQQTQTSIRRVVLVVGANNGGDGRTLLRYAGSDAERVAKLTRELGGVAAEDIIELRDSKRSSLEAALREVSSRLSGAQAAGTRLEFLFYYSGHSDETGLLLSGQKYSYKELRESVERMPAEVKIAILDSCASGAFTRTKGGKRRPAFLVDESSRVNGYAFIASSSATELAQESDRIASSFFTHYFVSGLRGGADSNRDGRVTLSEAYQYAFDETVSRTESTQAGAQHPAYNMHLAGTGDVVMTDLRSTSASLVVERDIVGRLFIRDSKGNLVVEITKRERHPITLGLAADTYSVVLLRDGVLAKANVALKSGRPSTLRGSSFTRFKGEQVVTRGGSATSQPRDIDTHYFGASLLPSIATSSRDIRRNVSINLLAGSIAELDGFELGGLVNHVAHDVRGVQIGGLVNTSGGSARGLQVAGLANIGTGEVRGVQLGGIANTSAHRATALQVGGVANINTGAASGLSIGGVANFTEDHRFGGQVGGVANIAGSLHGAQLGGVLNHSQGRTRGAQLAGVGNSAGRVTGLQVGGVANLSREIEGIQVAGVANVATDVRGLQLSTLNIASGKVSGVQIGVVNVAKEADASIGIVNIVGNGYRAMEAWTSDTSILALGFKLGARRTYTLFSAAQSISGDSSLGLGLGVHTPLNQYFVDIDVTAFSRADVWNDVAHNENDLLTKLRFTLGWKVHRDISLIGGLTFNTSHAFSKEGEERGIVHKVYRQDDYVLRYGPGAFVGASWNLGR